MGELNFRALGDDWRIEETYGTTDAGGVRRLWVRCRNQRTGGVAAVSLNPAIPLDQMTEDRWAEMLSHSRGRAEGRTGTSKAGLS